MESIRVKAAFPSDKNAFVDVIVRAFSADPVARWIYPDPHRYSAGFPPLVATFFDRACAHGTAYYVNDYAGAALWLPPGVGPDEDALAAAFDRTLPAERRRAVAELFAEMAGRHPPEPHWYLPLIGVDPARQRHGYGSILLHQALAACDREQKLAYLESSSPASVGLYRRHGFELLGPIRVADSPPLFPMVRRPRGKR
ncbi:MAG TPA: GNAT family N-acetyltransferase [Candidatus Acidoferrales bacterium]|nr:GNAT family N-acetyltransferase [Candidatus Acidoferrales bacterium]